MTTVILNQPDELQDIPGVVIPAPETGDAVIKNTFFFLMWIRSGCAG